MTQDTTTRNAESDIAGNVRAEIARVGKTVRGVALELGWSLSTFHRRCNGDGEFTATELHQLATLLGVPFATLFPPAAGP